MIRSGIPEVVNDIPDELLAQVARDPEHLALLRGAGLRAALTVPMFTGGGIVGALSLVSAESGRTFSGDDVDLAQELARRAGTAVENARLFTERERITAALQDGLRPSALPDVPGWTAAALYRPAGALDEVGGDFYDLFQTPGGWMLVVGDVTGHGAAAARLTAVARFALRAVVELSGNPIAALQQLNRMLLAEPELSLVTLVCAVLGPRIGDAASVDIIRCGHPAPLLVRPGDVEEIGEANPIVGAFPDAAWQATRVAMRAGETLLLYTDGVTDASGADERFGTERLLDSVRAQQTGAPQDLIAGVARVLTEFRVGAQRDDEALVALQLDEDPAALGPDTPLGIVTTRDGRDA